MGQGIARVGDIGTGVCAGHEIPLPYTTTFTEGSENVQINGLPAVVVGDQGTATCGDNTTALVGSPTVFINGKPVHRIGDTGQNLGPYTTTIGSINVLAG